MTKFDASNVGEPSGQQSKQQLQLLCHNAKNFGMFPTVNLNCINTLITRVTKFWLLWASGSQTFSNHVPFVGPILSPRTTFLQENSIYQILFDHKFGKPELAQMRHEDNGCEKL